jgi:hypothetical protein
MAVHPKMRAALPTSCHRSTSALTHLSTGALVDCELKCSLDARPTATNSRVAGDNRAPRTKPDRWHQLVHGINGHVPSKPMRPCMLVNPSMAAITVSVPPSRQERDRTRYSGLISSQDRSICPFFT